MQVQGKQNRESMEAPHNHSTKEFESQAQWGADALRSLSARLLRVQDDERRRIARELHDSTGQTLTALKIQLTSLQKRLRSGAVDDNNDFAEVNALADEALRDIRTLSHLLFPPLLEETGFCPAAKWYIEGFSRRSDIQVRLHLACIDRLPLLIETALFRILQESLTNIYRHSASRQVDVRIGEDASSVILEVQDYGRGISPQLLDEFKRAGTGAGVGLAGMRERMEDLGGELEIISNGSGTRIRAIARAVNAARKRNETAGFGIVLAA